MMMMMMMMKMIMMIMIMIMIMIIIMMIVGHNHRGKQQNYQVSNYESSSSILHQNQRKNNPSLFFNSNIFP